MRRDPARHYHSFSLATLACFGDAANDLSFMVLAIGYARRQLQTPALRLLKNPQVQSRSKGEKGSQEREILPKRAVFVADLGRKSILFLWSLAPCVLRPWFNCPLASGTTQMTSSKP